MLPPRLQKGFWARAMSFIKSGEPTKSQVLRYPSLEFNRDDVKGLDTVKVFPKDFDYEKGVYVIHFGGNAESWQRGRIYEAARNAARDGVASICFNPPGIGASKGERVSERDMIEAGKKQVKDLIEFGVKPERIILKGFSLGGETATLVASELKKEGKEVNLFNDRSFSSLNNVVKGWVKKLHLPVSEKFVDKVLKRYGWEMNASEAWKNIDEDKKVMLYTPQDAIITDRGGLFQAASREEKPNIVEISPSEVLENNHLSHLSYLTSKKLFQERNPDFDPYSIDASKRESSTFSITGETIFTDFVSKVKERILPPIFQTTPVIETGQGNGHELRQALTGQETSTSRPIQVVSATAAKANNHVR